MTNRSPEQIEREIEEERSALAGTLDELQSQFTPERWMNEISRQVTENGGAFSRQVGRAVRDNPIGLAVTGIGLALLFSNRSSDSDDDYPEAPVRRRHEPLTGAYPASPMLATRDRYATGGASQPSHPSRYHPASPGFSEAYDPADFDRRVQAMTADSDDDDDDGSSWGNFKNRVSAAGDRVAGAGEDARGKLGKAGDAARSRAEDLGDSARSTAQSARDKAGEMRDRAASTAEEMRRTIARGTRNMSEESRRRVYRARLAAIDAQTEIEARARHYGRRAHRTATENPILMGLIAMGVGAAVGATLPRTDMEDDAVGSYRDQMLDEARRVYAAESEKLRHVAEAAAEEGRNVVREELDGAKSTLRGSVDGEQAVEAAEDKAKTAAGRVAEAARESAEKEKLGDSVKTG